MVDFLKSCTDRRAGYQRQEDEDRNTPWTCECGARVIESYPGTASFKLHGRFYHPGECTLKPGDSGPIYTPDDMKPNAISGGEDGFIEQDHGT